MSQKKSDPTPGVDLSNFEALFSEILDRVNAATGANAEADLTLPDNPVSPGARVPEAAEWAATMIENAGRSGDRWLKNTLRPRKNPVTAAIAADKKRKDRLEEAERQGKWPAAMARVDVDAMYETIEEVGASGFTTGIAARKTKIQGKIEKLRPQVLALAETIDKMPEDTDAQREARMIAARRGMIQVGAKLRGLPTGKGG